MSSWHALHFNKIAKVIRTQRERIMHPMQKEVRDNLLNELTLEFAEYFRDQNPSFRANEFIGACGYHAEVKDES